MKDFDRSSVGKPRRTGRRSSGRSDKRDSRFKKHAMHKVICDKCRQSCEVPFKPTKGKPVYCSDCFEKQEEPSYGKGKFRPRRESRPESNGELQQINAKLDRILEILNN